MLVSSVRFRPLALSIFGLLQQATFCNASSVLRVCRQQQKYLKQVKRVYDRASLCWQTAPGRECFSHWQIVQAPVTLKMGGRQRAGVEIYPASHSPFSPVLRTFCRRWRGLLLGAGREKVY